MGPRLRRIPLAALGGLEGGDEDQQEAAERQRQQEAELADAHRGDAHPGRANPDQAGQPPGLASPDTPLLCPILKTSLGEEKCKVYSWQPTATVSSTGMLKKRACSLHHVVFHMWVKKFSFYTLVLAVFYKQCTLLILSK